MKDLSKIVEDIVKNINFFYDFRCINLERNLMDYIKRDIEEGNKLLSNKDNLRLKYKFMCCCAIIPQCFDIVEAIRVMGSKKKILEYRNYPDVYTKECEIIHNEINNLEETVKNYDIDISAFFKNCHGRINYYKFIVVDQYPREIKNSK